MKTIITGGLKGDAIQEVTSSFKSSRVIRERIIDILRKKIDTSRRESRKKEYSDASWAYSQADAIGYERGLEEVISILSEGKTGKSD